MVDDEVSFVESVRCLCDHVVVIDLAIAREGASEVRSRDQEVRS